ERLARSSAAARPGALARQRHAARSAPRRGCVRRKVGVTIGQPECKRLQKRGLILQDHTMKLLRAAATVLTVLLVTLSARASFDAAQDRQRATHDYPVQPVPFTRVHLTDGFWAPRIETNRKVTIPAAF